MGKVNELKGFTRGQLDSVLMRIGQDVGMGTAEGINAFLCGELIVSEPPRSWREQDGIIYFSVTSDGTTGPEWIKRLKDKGFCISDYAKALLNSSDFKPTSGITTEIAVLKGMLFSDSERITKKIRAYADKQDLTTPNAEIACLVREQFTDKDIKAMGLYWVIIMHEPINDSDGGPRLFAVHRNDDGAWLDAFWDEPGHGWSHDYGFAFVCSQG